MRSAWLRSGLLFGEGVGLRIRPEECVGLMDIVRATPQAQPLHGGRAARRKGLPVVKLEEAAFRAPTPPSRRDGASARQALLPDEGALTAVPLPDRAAHGRGNVARVRR